MPAVKRQKLDTELSKKIEQVELPGGAEVESESSQDASSSDNNESSGESVDTETEIALAQNPVKSKKTMSNTLD
jgi:hypothetical protein